MKEFELKEKTCLNLFTDEHHYIGCVYGHEGVKIVAIKGGFMYNPIHLQVYYNETIISSYWIESYQVEELCK